MSDLNFKKKYFKTDKNESFKTSWFRRLMNLYPMFFGTGGKILFWSGDWAEVHLKISLNIWTRNYVGTIFGGSLFSVTDPFYMLMLMHILGPDYVAWDKSASIKFKRPAKDNLYTKLLLSPEQITKIKSDIEMQNEITVDFTIQWIDYKNIVHAELVRSVYAAKKSFYKEKRRQKELSLKRPE